MTDQIEARVPYQPALIEQTAPEVNTAVTQKKFNLSRRQNKV